MKTILLLLLGITLFSCSKDDDGVSDISDPRCDEYFQYVEETYIQTQEAADELGFEPTYEGSKEWYKIEKARSCADVIELYENHGN